MTKLLVTLAIIFFFLPGCTNNDSTPATDTRDILEKLKSLEGITVTEQVSKHKQYKRLFTIDIVQEVDHSNSNGETFKQRIYLFHNSEELPMVMNTAGYGTYPYPYGELPYLFSNNFMIITHRYFKDAEPASMDWQHLNVKQAAADHHKIASLFKTIYQKKWLNTGGSKGGMTALFHRYFYPDDVDATLAFVAPVMTDLPDKRFDDFLKNKATTPEGVERINSFQRNVLKRREQMLDIFKKYAESKGYKISLGYNKALELATMEYWFSFFQYGKADLSTIPGENATDQELFDHLNSVSSLKYYSDDRVKSLMPFYYQAFTELGYYYLIDEHLKDLLIDTDCKGQKFLAPQGVEMVYDSSLMNKILSWLKSDARRIIYIYGAQDPYTATGVYPVPRDCYHYVVPGQDHMTRITQLSSEKQKVIKENLGKWLDITIPSFSGRIDETDDRENPDLRRGFSIYK